LKTTILSADDPFLFAKHHNSKKYKTDKKLLPSKTYCQIWDISRTFHLCELEMGEILSL